MQQRCKVRQLLPLSLVKTARVGLFPMANSQRVSVLQKEGHNERPIAIGRRNWLHLGSKEAGPKIAAIFSIVESCRKLGLPIRQYPADVLPGLADRAIRELTSLTPTAYAARSEK